MPNSGNIPIGGGRKAAAATASSNGEKISKKRSSAGSGVGGVGGASGVGGGDHGQGVAPVVSGAVGESGSGATNTAGVHPSPPPRPIEITSDEVNFLVYRFLQEAGFVHSAFTFAYESMVGNTSLSRTNVPPGALISFLQKGLQYVGIEETLRQEEEERMEAESAGAAAGNKTGRIKDNGSSTTDQPIDFTLLSPHSVQALTRRDPPIRVQIPSAHATAAIQARIDSTKPSRSLKRGVSAVSPTSNSVNLPTTAAGSSTMQPQKASSSSSNDTQQKSRQPQQQRSQGSKRARQDSSPKPMDIVEPARPGSVSSSQQQQQQQQQHYANGYYGEQTALHQRQAVNQNHLSQQQNQQHAKEKGGHAKSRLANNAFSTTASSTGKVPTIPILEQNRSAQRRSSHTSTSSHTSVEGGGGGNRMNDLSSASSLLQLQKQQQQQHNPHHLHLQQQQKKQQSKQKQQHPPAQQHSSVPHGFNQLDGAIQLDKQQQKSKVEQSGKQMHFKMNGSDPRKESTLINNAVNHGNNGAKQTHLQTNGKQSKDSDTATSSPVPNVIGNAVQHSQSKQPQHVSDTASTTNLEPQAGATPNDTGAASIAPSVTNINAVSIDKEDMLTRASPEEVLELNEHTSEVFMCAWNPIYTDLLATGSGDASARIWKMGGKEARAGTGQCQLLNHGSNATDRKNKDVTTLEWSTDGKHLATGSYDGVARIWTERGVLEQTLRGHTGPIFSLKWNKKGNYLLSGSYDKSTIVWDVSSGVVKQQFNHHMFPALDVDWKDDMTFASCSTDKTVLICKVGFAEPLHKFIGHTDEVNAVKWDPSGSLLASCSDDYTAKVWDVSSNKLEPLHDFKSHKQEIYTVKWSPIGKDPANPKPLRLATASFDGSVRLWDIKSGACIQILSRHRDSVYSVSFSPSGEYLASGSLAGQLYIWRIRDGKHVKNFKGQGDIFEVAWNVEETRVAACFSSNVVNVIDFKI